jgi:hypothetical protein
MYAAHIYPWKSKWQEKALDIAAVHPIFVAEVGADAKKMEWMPADQQEDAETWGPDILGLVQKNRLDWSAFSFHPLRHGFNLGAEKIITPSHDRAKTHHQKCPRDQKQHWATPHAKAPKS